MNVVQSRPVQSHSTEDASSPRGSKQGVNLYMDLPTYELSLDEFEEYALARLKVLRKLDELKVRNVTGPAFRQQMDDVLLKTGLAKDSSMDVASHFILRAAYCRTEELRRWFLLQETALFRHRIEGLSSIQHLATHLQQISASQKESLREKLLTVGGMSPAEFAATPYYAIPFTQALDLIRGRNAYVHGGLAYVPLPKLVSILANDFRMRLSQSLTFAAASFGSIPEEGARIKPLLQTMNSQYTGDANRYQGGAVVGTDLTAASIETMKHNMPLCMSELHKGLERDHKLKHWGRLQYGLFLKGAGMSMEESLLFFQRAFKDTSPEGFQKQYAYGIRHMYGKEGKRASYTPYNCPKIIVGNPPPQTSGEHHGCPFRHYDENHLSQVLGSSLSISDKNAIVALKKNHNYQLACAKHFEVLHPHATPDVPLDNVGNHPNAWFAASVSYHSKKQQQQQQHGAADHPQDVDIMDAVMS